jgi:hypothetical protein
MLTIQKIVVFFLGAIIVWFGCGRAGYGISVDGEAGEDAGDADGRIETDDEDLPPLDTEAPVVTSVEIEGGAATTGRNTVNLAVTVEDASPPIEVRVANAHPATNDCQSEYADDGWQAYADPVGTYPVTVSVIYGTKKVCAWAKDSLGNVSVIEPSGGTLGVDMDTIEYEVGTLPVITRLEVSNDTAGPNLGSRTYQPGDQVRVEWTVTDAEGLSNNPIYLYYTTDNESWTPILENHGGLSGNPKDYAASYTGFLAPASDYFRLKLVVWDMAGNTGIAAMSDAQNTGDWSVYAGSTDRGVGGTGLATGLLTFQDELSIQDAMDPTTHDLYSLDRCELVRQDARTGLVSRVMGCGTINLPDEGPLPAEPMLGLVTGLRFDSDGLLYILSGVYYNNCKIYQVDFKNSYVRAYLGGGDVFDDSATPQTVSLYSASFAFDENNNLYFYSSCTPGTWDDTSTVRLMKATQNPDKTAGDISVVAGNCVREEPASPGPLDALTSPLTGAPQPWHYGSLSVFNGGAAIYYHFSSTRRKILAGQSYSTNILGNSFYNPSNQKLYGTDGDITEYTPNLQGADGEVGTLFVANTGTDPNCVLDGVDALSACINAHYAMEVTPQGVMLFKDGHFNGSTRDFRMRYVDASGKLRTYLGHLPFHGDGASRRSLRGDLSGIYYKSALESNQAAFVEGLYFLEAGGAVFGHIDPVSQTVTAIAGNQSGLQPGPGFPGGADFGPVLNLGARNQLVQGRPMTFDAEGLPWLRLRSWITKVDLDRKLVELQGGWWMWDNAPDGADPYDYTAHVYGMWQNTALKDGGIFLIGRYTHNEVTIRYFDFDLGVVTWIMGGMVADGISPDNATPGSVKNLSISSSCRSKSSCFLRYRADEDRLYFAEEDKIRYITTPTDTANATLGTFFVLPGGGTMRNYIFHPDGSQLFYINNGSLYCHDITSGKAWCNDTPLGPPSVLAALENGPDQLTWRDDGHLLISNYQGEIYEYTLLP